MPDTDIRSLFQRYCDKSADELEIQQLMEWMADAENIPLLLDLMKEHWNTVLRHEHPIVPILTDSKSNEILDSILVGKLLAHPQPEYPTGNQPTAAQSITQPASNQSVNPHLSINQPNRFLRRLSIAAAFLALLGTSIWLLLPKNPPTAANNLPVTNDVQPGSNKAILTLADGSTIPLDSAGKGTLTQQGSTTITKLQGGALLYNASQQPGSANPDTYNTISTPKGGQYELTLPDGSRVWLNAASSLRFPVAFNGADRSVQLSGEAYFEITKDPNRPFHVLLDNKTHFDVLGTDFDIMAYDNESLRRTSLVNGSLRINHENQNLTLQPGQQGIFDKKLTLAKNADISKAIAWKNGRFDFEDDDIQTIMRQLERWYNITVIYDDTPPPQTYTGEIRRQVPISQVLKMLKLAGGVDFDIQGNKITVRKP